MTSKKIFLGIFVVATILISLLLLQNKNTYTVNYLDFLQMLEGNEVVSVTISDNPQIQFKLKDDDLIYLTDNPRNPELKEQLLHKNIEVKEGSFVGTNSYVKLILSILIIPVVFLFINYINKNKKNAMALNVLDYSDKSDITLSFSDVAGNDEAKESVQDLVDFIKNPAKYAKYGARMPRGIIFYGSPGTGKTLMAKAIAGEAQVPFYAVSGSDFIQMYAGVGASRIREIFKKARESKKAVIFIDEIDAIGKKRGVSANTSNDERDQTLNALLTEMSGFSSTDGIVVISATNRLDTLDEALLRPGRFDRQIEIGLPDINSRKTILQHHAENKPISKDICFKRLAKETVYFSGAMLENLLNESAIISAKNNREEILQEDIDKAFYTIIAGSEKKDRSSVKELDKKITAFHEAGHALVAKLTSPENTISRISIIPSTKGAGGFCINIPPDKMYYTKLELKSQIMINVAGRGAEELIFGEENITTGASNDIEKATSIAKDFVMRFGMSKKMGLLNLTLFKDESMAFAECKELLDEIYNETKELLKENINTLTLIANTLMEKETLNEYEFIELIKCA